MPGLTAGLGTPSQDFLIIAVAESVMAATPTDAPARGYDGSSRQRPRRRWPSTPHCCPPAGAAGAAGAAPWRAHRATAGSASLTARAGSSRSRRAAPAAVGPRTTRTWAAWRVPQKHVHPSGCSARHASSTGPGLSCWRCVARGTSERLVCRRRTASGCSQAETSARL